MIEISDISSLKDSEREEIIDRMKVEFRDIEPIVRSIIDAVRKRGSEAVSEFVKRYDKVDLSSFRVTEEEISRAIKNAPQELVTNLTKAAENIFKFQRKQMPSEFRIEGKGGVLGQKIVPLARVGVYAPGGTAIYPSSVLMGCIPAKVAGVPEIVLCTPPRADGAIDESMIVAADLAGASEIYKISGVQAIAAMAYGIEEMLPVDKIVGPGNKYVTAAKKIVSADCDIEFLAGPSEILIIADDTADAEMIALDMLAQLEHDADSEAVLISISRKFAEELSLKIEELWKDMPRSEIIGQAIMGGCRILVAESMEEAVDLANDYAPEHLTIAVRDPESAMRNIYNAGSIFLGNWSSVAYGDYCAGPNHVLPTMGLAERRGALSPSDFIKAVPYQKTSKRGAAKLSPIASAIARAEGLEAHARAAESRSRKSERE